VNQKPETLIIYIPGDVSERGSVILLEMADEAIKVAQKSLKTPGAAQQAEMRDWLRLRDRFPRTKIQLRQQALPKILEA